MNIWDLVLWTYLLGILPVWIIVIRMMLLSMLKEKREYTKDSELKIDGDMLFVSGMMGLLLSSIWPLTVVAWFVVQWAIKPIKAIMPPRKKA